MRHQLISVAIAVLTLAAAQRAGAVTIAEIIANPEAYDRATVTVTGDVDKAVPVGAESGYNLRAGSAVITVISRSSAPAVGAHLTVTATVRAFDEGDEPEAMQFPPLLIESSRQVAP